MNQPAVDDLAGYRIFGGEGLRLSLNLNGLSGTCNLQSEIGGRVLADVQLDVGAYGLLKSLHFCRHGIHSGRNRDEYMPPSTVRRGREMISLLLVEERHFCPLNDGCGGVCQNAAYRAEVALAEKHTGKYNHGCDDQESG